MKIPFKSVGLICKQPTAPIVETLIALWTYLTSLPDMKVVVEAETAKMIKSLHPQSVHKEKLSDECHLMIVVGGDGSMLYAAHAIADQDIPMIGINRGNLGFLTDITPTDVQTKLKSILDGSYHEEKRFLLSGHLSSNPKKQFYALNEITLLSSPHMSEFEIYIDDHFVCSHRADGLIIATPTGSTAYALSSGGPIIHPSINACVLLPIASHTLTARPIVVNADGEIKIVIANSRANEYKTSSPHLSADGNLQPIKSDETIIITKKPTPLRLIHPLDYTYYEALRSKLYWGKKL